MLMRVLILPTTLLMWEPYLTNVGAIFACITDIPFFTYLLYTFVLKNAYHKAVHQVSDESYHSCVDENPTLTMEMHEELYQRYISKLQSLGLEDFYQNPDPLAPTGALYNELVPILEEIDQEIKKGLSIRGLGKIAWRHLSKNLAQ